MSLFSNLTLQALRRLMLRWSQLMARKEQRCQAAP